MLSYEHDFHAGNHGDILKHLCLVKILDTLVKKEKPFTIIESHSGSGIYNLNDERSLKTKEAINGIKKLYKFNENPAIPFTQNLTEYIEIEKPYLERNLYAGSVEIEKMYLRKGDSLHVAEKHPKAIEQLKINCTKPFYKNEGEKEAQAKIHIYEDDGFSTLIKLTPPLIKRGLILCDPSYESENDYKEVAKTLSIVHKKWNTAIIALWYPLLTTKKYALSQMINALENCVKLNKIQSDYINLQLKIADEDSFSNEEGKAHMYGSGMFIINPPYQMKEELSKTIQLTEKLLTI